MRSIAMSVYVCLYVCPFAYRRNSILEFHEVFCQYCLWPWLGPPMMTMQYVLYVRFCGQLNHILVTVRTGFRCVTSLRPLATGFPQRGTLHSGECRLLLR